jgi:hypothetical protein
MPSLHPRTIVWELGPTLKPVQAPSLLCSLSNQGGRRFAYGSHRKLPRSDMSNVTRLLRRHTTPRTTLVNPHCTAIQEHGNVGVFSWHEMRCTDRMARIQSYTALCAVTGTCQSPLVLVFTFFLYRPPFSPMSTQEAEQAGVTGVHIGGISTPASLANLAGHLLGCGPCRGRSLQARAFWLLAPWVK